MKRLRPFCMMIFLALICWFVTVPSGRAELPPDVYDKLQREAPELLTIEVLAVKTEAKAFKDTVYVNVTAEARVRKVQRSKSQLQEGAVISIAYVHRQRKVPVDGPSEIPILAKGKVYPAYLEKKRDGYEPAARGHSFEHVFAMQYRKMGGFAGIDVRGRIDSGDLSDEQMARLREMLIKVDFFRRSSDSKTPTVTDDFRYEITVHYGHILHNTVAVWGKTAQADLLPLLRYVDEVIAKKK